jgi:hypothetical protein
METCDKNATKYQTKINKLKDEKITSVSSFIIGLISHIISQSFASSELMLVNKGFCC